MVHFNTHESLKENLQRTGSRQAHPIEVEGIARSVDAALRQAYSQDEQGPALKRLAEAQEPYFPTYDEAVDLNKAAIGLGHKLWGDSPEWGGILRPNELESAVHSAQQHYAYGPEEDDGERLAIAAGKMGWRLGTQVFHNGNKRTAYWLVREMLDRNGLGHLSPLDHDDTEFADHLVAQDRYGADKTLTPEQMQQQRNQTEENFINLWRNRYHQGGPQYVQDCQCGHCVGEPYQQQYPSGSYIVDVGTPPAPGEL